MAMVRRDADAQNACSYRLIAHLIAHYTAAYVALLRAGQVAPNHASNPMGYLWRFTLRKSLPLRGQVPVRQSGQDTIKNLMGIVLQRPLLNTSFYLLQLRATDLMARLGARNATRSLCRKVAKDLRFRAVHQAQ